MFSKSSAYILLVTVFLCFLSNGILATSFFDNITGKLLVWNLDKTCPVTADIAKLNREKANAVPKLDDISFELRSPCQSGHLTMSEAGQLQKAVGFDNDKKTVVFITANIDDQSVQKLAEAYHCRNEYNFLVVDTSKYLQTAEYVSAAINVEIIGAHIATGLHNANIDSENINLVGLGLGAHVAGSAGFNYAKTGGEKIARITGLDPIRPCFKSGAIRSLQRDDATFVDVIHTNPGILGLEDALGHVDFYPTGLELIKPGCDEHYMCSHKRALEYFIETVVPGKEHNFMATHCNAITDISGGSCSGAKVPMGFAADKEVEGIFYLSVKAASPYGADDTGAEAKKCEVCAN